jgi:hypothetical protein
MDLRAIYSQPIPVDTSMYLEVIVPKQKFAVIRMLDFNGNIVRMLTWELKPGRNSTELDDLHKLAGGLYFMDVVDQRGQIIYEARLLKD